MVAEFDFQEWDTRFAELFKGYPPIGDGSMFMVVPKDVIAQHQRAWLGDELWRLNAASGSGDTIADSGDELENEDGDRITS